jgi:hypothetical protein
MRLRLKLAFVFVATLLTVSALEWSMLAADNAKSSTDVWYLLVRRAEGKNYYDLSRTAQLLEPQLFNDELFSRYQPSSRHMGFDISTDSTVRYGVYQAWKVRVVGTSDSVKMPASSKDSAYVLIDPRNANWKFCAKKYSVAPLRGGARRIVYTDFQDGKENVIDVSADWPRPWQIYEIEIVKANAFVEIWEVSKRSREGVH